MRPAGAAVIKMTVTGVDAVKLELRNIADRVTDAARARMKRSADRMVKEAQLNAPVDEHNLEESIRIEKDYAADGRLEIDVIAGGMVGGVDVDDYAAEMHENYESYRPGEGTIEKRLANPGRYVGGKFLERAAEAENEKLPAEIRSDIDKVIG
ncbi:MAG: HK97 gp10 family phage protein [Mesorhizobium sp.]|nr:MAG: HK97 gp10 family phage protein [Mesorhizobium sp.]